MVAAAGLEISGRPVKSFEHKRRGVMGNKETASDAIADEDIK